MKGRLLFISYRFAPEPFPTATRAGRIATELDSWDIDLITASRIDSVPSHINVHHVESISSPPAIGFFKESPLSSLLSISNQPDQFINWTFSAYRYAKQLIQKIDFDGIVVFMMPFSQGIAGVWLKREFGLPLILNLDDSPTCSDMHATYATRLHYAFYRRLEDWYVQNADATIFVSKRNLKRVQQRQPVEHHHKVHLVRYGSDRLANVQNRPAEKQSFRVVYTGGTGGWYLFLDNITPPSLPKRAYRKLKKLVQYSTTQLDHRSHGPVYVGQAIQNAKADLNFEANIYLDVFGRLYPNQVVNSVLEHFGIRDAVNMRGLVSHSKALGHIQDCDLLFMSLPERMDGSPGGRISAKTYEYLMTDRPILAALPPGENRDYLTDKPGVYLSAPSNVDRMTSIISRLAKIKSSGKILNIERSHIHDSMSWFSRAKKFELLIQSTI